MYRNLTYILTLICLLAIYSYVSAQDEDSQQLVNKQKYQWAIEEVLQQLKELNREVNGIKQDITKLNTKIDTLAKNQPVRPSKAPAPKSVQLGSNRLGSDQAKYAIIEFTDYQCPYCARHSKSVLPQIKKELIDTGKVLYNLRDYPLSFHRTAKDAAIAAHCAGEQGQYWEMHAQLFANQRKLSSDLYHEKAKNLGLDEATFNECLKNPQPLQQVQQDLAYGNRLGVTGTPKFYVGKINGETITEVAVISGAQPYSVFKGALNNLGFNN